MSGRKNTGNKKNFFPNILLSLVVYKQKKTKHIFSFKKFPIEKKSTKRPKIRLNDKNSLKKETLLTPELF